MEKHWLRHYPAGVAPEVPTEGPPTLPALIEDVARRWPERPAYRCLGRTLSYAELDEHSRALAAWLRAQGLARGDRVAMLLPNVPQLPVTVAAVLRAGLVLVAVDPLLSARELMQRLKDAGARAVVVSEGAAATLDEVLESLPPLHVVVARLGDLLGPLHGALVNHVVRRVRKQPAAGAGLPGAVRFADALARGRKLPQEVPAVSPDDIAMLPFTGGTTGTPKGAVLLHRHLVANVLQCEAWMGPALTRLPAGEPWVTVGALPLHHIFGFTVTLLLPWRVGGLVLLVPDASDTGALLKTLAGQRFHCFPGVDPLFAAITAHPDATRVDWTGLRLALAGGGAVRPGTARTWAALTGRPVCEGYGLTEASPCVTCNPVDLDAFDGSIGWPLPGTDIALLDDEGRPVPVGERGELAIRGPQVMAGYWQRPDETARVTAPGGWLRTGDIAQFDAQGRLRLVDRKKDLIFVSGFNVFPGEVEDVLGQMPGVLECAAVGVPDERVGEAVKVVVVRRLGGGAGPTEADVRQWCERHLTGHKRPRQVEFRDALPRSAVGKVLRRALREPA